MMFVVGKIEYFIKFMTAEQTNGGITTSQE